MSITTNKIKNPLYSNKISIVGYQTATYTCTGAWLNVGNGLSVTIPVTGLYRLSYNIEAAIYFAAENSMTVQVRLWDGSAEIVGSRSKLAKNFNTGFYITSTLSVDTPVVMLTAGTVITVQAYRGGVDTGQLLFNATNTYFLQAELVEQVVSVRDISEDYSLSETDTGKNWIDGKRIYRKCFSGISSAAVGNTIASGVVPDNVIKLEYIQKSSINVTLFPGSEHTSGGLDTCYAWWQNASHASPNTIYLYHSVASVQSLPYFIIMEYTK